MNRLSGPSSFLDLTGDNLTRVESYLHTFNPHMPTMQRDIPRFADVAQLYGDAAPDLLRTLKNTIIVSVESKLERSKELVLSGSRAS